MEYRTLGNIGFEVSEIALGCGQLHRSTDRTVAAVADEALDCGLNYLDVALPFKRDRTLRLLGRAVRGRREQVLLAVHFDGIEQGGQVVGLSRDGRECEQVFAATLSQLQTEYADVVFISHVDDASEYELAARAGGSLELALRLKQEGKARLIGMSGHKVPVALRAVESGCFDVLMFPINPASDAMPLEAGLWETMGFLGAKAGAEPQPKNARKVLYQACAARGVGLIAMKPFFGGWSFKDGLPLTPVQCLSYALSQPGVSSAAAGVKDLKELRAALAYRNATGQQKDFAEAVARTKWNLAGNCLYCSHCQPCPAGIDIAQTFRLLDIAKQGSSPGLRAQYRKLLAPASACNGCGGCEERCPFGVAVIQRMKEATKSFEARKRA